MPAMMPDDEHRCAVDAHGEERRIEVRISGLAEDDFGEQADEGGEDRGEEDEGSAGKQQAAGEIEGDRRQHYVEAAEGGEERLGALDLLEQHEQRGGHQGVLQVDALDEGDAHWLGA